MTQQASSLWKRLRGFLTSDLGRFAGGSAVSDPLGLLAVERERVAALRPRQPDGSAQAAPAAGQGTQDTREMYVSMWALPELIEASTGSGNTQLATDALKRLAETTRPSGTDFGLGMEARSRVLVGEGEVAEGFYREAIDRLGRTRLRPELARAHLLYGEWLRRQNRHADARAQLRTAHEMLTTMGVVGFTERARHELLAIGETVRKRTVETPGALTPQEAYIARLARD